MADTSTSGRSHALVQFSFETRDVRTLSVDGEPWFVASDLANILGFRDASNAVRGLDDDERGTQDVSTPWGPMSMTVVSESGLYSLILRSRKEEAKRFKRWVTRELLPQIRRTGVYEAPLLPGQRSASVMQAARRRMTDFYAACQSAAKAEGRAAPSIDDSGLAEIAETFLHDVLAHSRWLAAYDSSGRMCLRAIPADAIVATPKDVLRHLVEPGGFEIDDDDLYRFALALLTRLDQRRAHWRGMADKGGAR